MKKLLMLCAAATTLALVGSAFAQCTTSSCTSQKSSVTQNITITVPQRMKLVIDSSIGSNTLAPWSLDLSSGLPGASVLTASNVNTASGCYAVPNTVATAALPAFIAGALNHGGLVPASNYPAIFSNNGNVETWSTVLSNNGISDGNSPYQAYASAKAKGNVVCHYPFMVEKYTNCPNGATFAMSLAPTSDGPASGFGAFQATDVSNLGGTTAQGSAAAAPAKNAWITSANGSSHTLSSIAPYNFYDDHVSEWLWLKKAQPNTNPYALTATYTLANLTTSGT